MNTTRTLAGALSEGGRRALATLTGAIAHNARADRFAKETACRLAGIDDAAAGAEIGMMVSDLRQRRP